MLTQKHLKESLNYNSETGVFIWLERPISHFSSVKSCKKTNTQYSGLVAGHVKTDSKRRASYRHISVSGNQYRAHRLAWFYVFNEWPEEIDHIDGDGENNAIYNLRSVSPLVNCQNKPRRIDNKTGVTGVAWCKTKLKWIASIRVKGVLKVLITSGDFFEACCRRKSAELMFGFHANHGR